MKIHQTSADSHHETDVTIEMSREEFMWLQTIMQELDECHLTPNEDTIQRWNNQDDLIEKFQGVANLLQVHRDIRDWKPPIPILE